MADTNNYYRSGSAYVFDKSYIKSLSMRKKITPSKEWQQDEIKQLLQSHDLFVVKSLLKLYSYQTEEEKLSENTNELNGVGFNSYDAPILCNIANQLVEKTFITIKQISYVRNKILKYSKQLTYIANGRI